jgi:putative sterol carrier protein
MSDEGVTSNGSKTLDPSQVDAEELAKNMSQASDEQLAELMSGPMREQILDEIFKRMELHFRADAARETEAVIWWRIGGRADGGHDEFETVISAGSCSVGRGLDADEARVTFMIGGADFLRLVTGNAAGPMLFMTGKLKIEGDMMFAASAASLFTIPKG